MAGDLTDQKQVKHPGSGFREPAEKLSKIHLKFLDFWTVVTMAERFWIFLPKKHNSNLNKLES